MRSVVLCVVGYFVGVWGCAGATPPPAAPEPSLAEAAALAEPSTAQPAAEAEAGEAVEEKPAAKPAKASRPEPDFKEGMSVDEAMQAVPPEGERVNMDPETLAKPLEDARVYEPCRPAGSHFKIRVAVWNGKPVGIDVESSNPTLAQCVTGRVRELTWRAKVPSLNTIEFSY